jgi:hypothetical protein
MSIELNQKGDFEKEEGEIAYIEPLSKISTNNQFLEQLGRELDIIAHI